MGIPPFDLWRQADLGEQCINALLAVRSASAQTQCQQTFFQRVADAHPRIQRSIRVLKNNLHIASPGTQGLAIQRQKIAAAQNDLATGRRHQPQQALAHRGLAAT